MTDQPEHCAEKTECEYPVSLNSSSLSYRLHPIRCYYGSEFHHGASDYCNDCHNPIVTTFHMAYFSQRGLDFKRTRSEPVGRILIDTLLIAQAYVILETQARAVRPVVFSLETLALYRLVVSCSHVLHLLRIPIKLRSKIENFEGGSDVVDRLMSQTVGNTIFRPFIFPRFLFRHLGLYLPPFP